MGTLEHGAQACVGREEVCVVAKDKVLEGRRIEVLSNTSLREPLPSHKDGRIDADEQEKGAFEQRVDNCVVPDVGRDPAFSPAQRDKVDEGIDAGERLGLLTTGLCDGIGRSCGSGGARLDETDVPEAQLVDEVLRNRRLARADSWAGSAAGGLLLRRCLPPHSPMSMVSDACSPCRGLSFLSWSSHSARLPVC